MPSLLLADHIAFAHFLSFAALLVPAAWGQPANNAASSSPESKMENPLLTPSPLPFAAPPFDKIKTEHYLPAYEEAIARDLAAFQEIAAQAAAPDLANTLIRMEQVDGVLGRVERVFSHMTAADTNPELQKIQATVAPKLAAHLDDIFLDRKLFRRIEDLWSHKESLGLTPEQERLLKERYESFIRAGALLDEGPQARVRAINEELSKLTTQFQENLLEITKQSAVLVDDVKDLDGLSAGDIATAAEAATTRGNSGKYLLAITNTTRQPVLSSLKNRDLRRRVWEASAYRGLGRNGSIDNRPLVLKIAQLRAEKAKLLGFPNHAAYTLQNQMAEEPAAARKMLADLIPALLAKTKEEAADLTAVAKAEGAEITLEPWDWEFYAEKVRQKKFDVDESVVRPYFELERVLQKGVFHTMGRLYGITYRERKDLPTYHPDVRVFDVMDSDGEQLGLFYADYYARDSKRGGAWMSSFVDQSGLLKEKPVVVNVMNVPKPAPGEPTLLSFDLMTTMFHEMGHALHGMFSDVEYPLLSGTNVPRDFVEFPSTFHEDWAIHPEILANYAQHHQTGEQIPPELLKKVIAASKFNQGFDTLEYVAAALLDLEWHSLDADSIPKDVEAFEHQALEKLGIDVKAIPPRYRTAFFAHIWPGGYSSSYYAYLWSEVLAADAFASMRDQGGLTRTNGDRFRKLILSRGGSQEPMEMYIGYRGREPSVDALLIRRGLK